MPMPARISGRSPGHFLENGYGALSGNVAMAMAGAVAGVKFYCAYPMSPSTRVLHWMAAHARKAGIMVPRWKMKLEW